MRVVDLLLHGTPCVGRLSVWGETKGPLPSIHDYPPNMWSRHRRLSVPKTACLNKTWMKYDEISMNTPQTSDLGTAVCLCLRMLVSTRLGGIIHVYPPNMWSRHCCLPVPKKACFNKTWGIIHDYPPNMWSRHCRLSVPKKACFNKTLGNYPWLPPKTCDLGTAVCLCPRKLVSTKLGWDIHEYPPNMWSRHCRLSVPKKACFNQTWVKYP